MKNLTIFLFIMVIFFGHQINAEEIKVIKSDISPINVTVHYDFFTVVELENEVLDFVQLNTKSLQVQKLNNKSILISVDDIYEENLPISLGKVIINDSACNSYAINFINGKQEKDQVISITNSNKQRTCEAKDAKKGFAATSNAKILYSKQ